MVSPAIAALRQRLSGWETDEGRLKGLRDFKPRARDVLIVTTPKAGTTWAQQIVHQLRTRCEGSISEDFEEISEVIPFLETAYDLGMDVNNSKQDEFELFPRAFKTHAWYPHCPKGARYIYVIREPLDVVVSFFKFFEGWFFQPGELSLEEFAESFWLRRGAPGLDDWMTNASVWDHLLSWWPLRHEPNVLFLFYEDLLADLRGQVLRVAKFLEISPDGALIDKVTERSSFGYMKQRERQFDEHLGKLARNEAMGLPRDAGLHNSKVRAGGGGKEALPPRLKEEILSRWRRQVGEATGHETYASMREAFHKELASRAETS